MIRFLSAARADFLAHQVPESGYWLSDMLFGVPLMALLLWGIVS